MLETGGQSLCAQSPDFEALVLDDGSGNPLASAEVRCHKVGVPELAADLDTDREGKIRAPGLPPGDYLIEVVKPNYVTAAIKTRIPAAAMVVRLVRHAIISGEVTDSQGRPVLGRISAPGGRTIGGARIAVLQKEPNGFRLSRERELGDDGKFRIYDLAPGEYAIALWYDGLKDGSGVMMYPDLEHPRVFAVAGGEEFRNVNFQLSTTAVFKVTGTVQLPKPKTRVALALGRRDHPLLPIAQTITDGNTGDFKFDRIPPGTYDLYVAGPDQGYSAHGSLMGPDPFFGRTQVNVGAADVTGLEVAVSPGKTVKVKLAGASGEQPPDGCPQRAAVAPELLEPWGILFTAPTTPIQFATEQTIRNLTPGRVRLRASDLGPTCYSVEEPIVDLSGDAPPVVTLRVAPAGWLRGVLGGAQASDYTIVLLDADAARNPQARLAAPDNNGKFEFQDLQPGRYWVAAQPTKQKSRWVSDVSKMMPVQVIAGAPTDIQIAPAGKGGGQ